MRRVTTVSRALLALAVAAVVSGGLGVVAVHAATRSGRPVPAETVATFSPLPAPPPLRPGPSALPTTTTTAPAPSTTTSDGPPATSAPAPSPAPVRLVPGQEATVVIPSLGIDLPVVEGGQAVIDEGVVAHYSGPGWRAPTPAGAVGTYWLAAHHVTHGGPFGRLPAIHIGAQVLVVTAAHTYTYTVTSLQVAGTTATYATVYGTQPTARLALLQTCLGATERLLVHGVLTATS